MAFVHFHTASPAANQHSDSHTRSAQSDTNEVTQRAMEIIASECGIEVSDLQDSMTHQDSGADSLLQLVIVGRLRKELGIKLDASLFTSSTTLSSLKSYLATAKVS
jgi:acyl carrier protein